MSYIHLSSFNAPNSTKGTISLWFRVSQDSVTKAKQHAANYPADDPLKNEILKGTIPLITFGRKVTGTIWDSQGREDCRSEPDASGAFARVYSFHPINPTDSPMQPSHIGLSCYLHADVMPTLLIVLQTPQKATAQGLHNERVECHYSPRLGPGLWLYETLAEASYILTDRPEAFTIDPELYVKPDTWHHLLVSWDLSTSVDTVAIQQADPIENGAAIKGACKLYYAFDDENKTGQDNMGSAWAYKGDNDVVPDGAFDADFSYLPIAPPTDDFGEPLITGTVSTSPEWHWTSSPLPLSGGHVGVPAGAEYVDNVYHVEMAELQFFAGKILNTANVNNRRAFIDFVRDKDGNPIVDENGKGTLEPVPPSQAEKLVPDPTKPKETLGRPHILLHGTGDWQKGRNTGSIGLEISDEGKEEVIPSGQFEPVGGIEPYKPDPSLKQSTA